MKSLITYFHNLQISRFISNPHQKRINHAKDFEEKYPHVRVTDVLIKNSVFCCDAQLFRTQKKIHNDIKIKEVKMIIVVDKWLHSLKQLIMNDLKHILPKISGV